MIFHLLSYDNLYIILDYLYQIIDLRCLLSTSSFFHSESILFFIHTLIQKKKNNISKSFPELVIRLFGGYNDFLHINILSSSYLSNIHDIDHISSDFVLNLFHHENGILLTNYASGKSLIIAKINSNVFYLIYQKYSHFCSDWYVKYYLNISFDGHSYSRTIRILEFKKGYLQYTDYRKKLPQLHYQLYPLLSTITNKL